MHSYEARLVAASFDGDAAAQEEAMNAARAAQAINYDAICGAAEEWATFASRLAEDLKFHPLPMHDLIKEINRRTENKYLVALDAIRMDALQKATQVTKEETVNRDACVSIAHALMGRSDGAVALFSYDGEHGGKIRLGEHLRGGGVAIRMDALQKATQVTKDETVNRDACVSIAHALMGRSDGAVALFSYDGEHGGKIRLGEHLRGGGVAWKYS